MSPRTTVDTGRYRAFGSGPATDDGSSVEVYRRLPYRGEVDQLEPWIPEECSVLELGCGTGRMTRALLAKGYRVTAVDNSADMLAEVPDDATKVLSSIEDLDIGEPFDVVMLAADASVD